MISRSSARRVAVALLVAALVAQVLPPLISKSSVCDEAGVHVPAGYLYWQTGVFGGGINNPPLMQLLVAAPLALGGLDYSPFSDDGMWAARLPVLAISVALALTVYAWAGALYGGAAAPAALFLYCFEPNVIAHSGLATLDLGVTFALFAAFFFVWRTWRDGRTSSWAAACVSMAAATLCKFTALLVLPAFAALLAVALWRRGPPARRLRRIVLALAFLCACTVALSQLLYHLPIGRSERTVVLLGEGGGEVESPRSLAARAPAARAPEPGAAADGVAGLERAARVLLPDRFVDGTLGKLKHAGAGHFSYLAGRRSMGGWWYYFLAALSLKTPIPFLAVFVASLLTGAALRDRWRDAAFLLVPMIFYVAAMSWTGIDIGVRHVLLFYPLAAVLASSVLARGLPRNRIALVAIGAMALWEAAESVAINPDYLAYFNEIAGGPGGGSRYLIDSNVDWGQDDGLLARFVSESPDTVLVNPGGFAPCVGTIAVNVNSLRGIFRGDDSAYRWLGPFTTRRKLGYTWYVYDLDVGDYERAAEESPGSAERRVWLAFALRKSGRLDEALEINEEVAREYPDRGANAWFNSGWWLIQEGRFLEAESALVTAVEMGAGETASDALRAARAEVKRAGGDASAADLIRLVDFYSRADLLDRASAVVTEGIAAMPESGGLRLERALLLARRGDYAGALGEAEAAAALDPMLSRARQLSDWARVMIGLERVKGTYGAQMELGRQEYRFGRPASAAVHFWNAMMLDPSSEEALSAMGEIIVQGKLGVLRLETPWDARWPI
jgi:4-amino-4-deoxy-L-arabinose transferase-like glycosyltransferase/tetratricopeptide (TPR) repeat protein